MSIVDDKFKQDQDKIHGPDVKNYSTSDYNFLKTLTSLYGNTMSAKGINLLDPLYSNIFHYNKIQNMSIVDGPRVSRSYCFFTRPELNFSAENINVVPFFSWLYSKPIGKMIMSALTDPMYYIGAPSILNGDPKYNASKYQEALSKFRTYIKSIDKNYNTKINQFYGADINSSGTNEDPFGDFGKQMWESLGKAETTSASDTAASSEEELASMPIDELMSSDLSSDKLSSMVQSIYSNYDVDKMKSIWNLYTSEFDKLSLKDKGVDLPEQDVAEGYRAKYIMRSTHKHLYDAFNYTSPFIPLLGNTCTSITGAKALNLETFAYEEDEFSGNIQVPTGMDSLWGSGQITASFDDIMYSPVALLFNLWIFYIHYVSRGYISPTREHVIERILDYTCSIYVFVIGADGRTIERFCKYTGCYPTTLNLDSQLDFNQQPDPEMLKKIQVTFNYNRFEPMNPEIFTDFNFVSQTEWLFKLKDWDLSSYSRKNHTIFSSLKDIDYEDPKRPTSELAKAMLHYSGRPEKQWGLVGDVGMSGRVPRALINGTSIDPVEDLSESDMINNYWGGYPYINNGGELIWVLPRVKPALNEQDPKKTLNSVSKWKESAKSNIEKGLTGE